MVFTAKEKTGPTGPSVEDLQKKLAEMEDAARIRRKYGQGCTDASVAFYLAEERKTIEKKKIRADNEAKGRAEAEKRQVEIRKAAVQMVKDNRLIIAVNGQRVEINNDLQAPCPYCGAGMVHSFDPIYTYAARWHTTLEKERFGTYSELLIFSAKNPLSSHIGAPLYMGGIVCQACKKTSTVMVQLVVI